MKGIPYIVLIIAYAIIIVTFFAKFEISYRMVGVRPELVQQRTLTLEENTLLNKAEVIRHTISFLLLSFSVIMAIISAIIWYFHLYKPLIIPKLVLGISILWALLLIIVNGIHFVPTAPVI
jgi:hypothetical protein